MALIAEIIVTALVTGFLAQLVTEDTITAPLREWLSDRSWTPLGEASNEARICRPRQPFMFLSKVTDCYRCAGVWLAFFATWLVTDSAIWNDVRTYVIVFLSASFAQYALMSWIDSLHRPLKLETTITTDDTIEVTAEAPHPSTLAKRDSE